MNTLQTRDIAKAFHWALTCVLVCLSYFTIKTSLIIPHLVELHAFIAEDETMPLVSRLAASGSAFFTTLSVLIPLTAISLNFIRRPVFSIYLSGALTFLGVSLLIFNLHAICGPWARIVFGASVS